jgi:hypothetical protein
MHPRIETPFAINEYNIYSILGGNPRKIYL